jgi:hypothetical protein
MAGLNTRRLSTCREKNATRVWLKNGAASRSLTMIIGVYQVIDAEIFIRRTGTGKLTLREEMNRKVSA